MFICSEDMRLWIGLADQISEGNFRWVNSRVPNWVDWLEKQPNGTKQSLYNCVEYISLGGIWGWNDQNCDEIKPFICQHSG